MRLENKVTLITGAGSGIGRATALLFASEGAQVMVSDVDEDAAVITADIVRKCGGAVDICIGDVTEEGEAARIVQQTITQFGQLQVLVNSAGITARNLPSDSKPFDVWRRVIDVNLKGVFLSCQILGSAMAQSGRGSIINIGSIYGILSPDQRLYEYRRNSDEVFFKPVAYSASKSGIYGLSRYLATYWANNNVRVNTLTLGGVFNNQDKEFLDEYHKKVPLGRMAKSEEYGGAIIFLLSSASSYMTGTNMIMDGGLSAW